MTSVEEPAELKNIPEFIKILQQKPIDKIKTDPPSEDEIKKVLKRLKNGKSANDIPAEFFKYAHQSPELIAEMEKLIAIIWKTDTTLIKILHTLYESLTTALSETPEDIIELILAVRQGGPESPSLYNLFMDYAMRIYTHQCEEEFNYTQILYTERRMWNEILHRRTHHSLDRLC